MVTTRVTERVTVEALTVPDHVKLHARHRRQGAPEPVIEESQTTLRGEGTVRVRRPDRRPAGPHALGRFGANSAWILCAAIAHNLLRAPACWPGHNSGCPRSHAAAQDRHIPARLARPQRRPVLHLPRHWPWSQPWLRCGTTQSIQPPGNRDILTNRRKARPET